MEEGEEGGRRRAVTAEPSVGGSASRTSAGQHHHSSSADSTASGSTSSYGQVRSERATSPLHPQHQQQFQSLHQGQPTAQPPLKSPTYGVFQRDRTISSTTSAPEYFSETGGEALGGRRVVSIDGRLFRFNGAGDRLDLVQMPTGQDPRESLSLPIDWKPLRQIVTDRNIVVLPPQGLALPRCTRTNDLSRPNLPDPLSTFAPSHLSSDHTPRPRSRPSPPREAPARPSLSGLSLGPCSTQARHPLRRRAKASTGTRSGCRPLRLTRLGPHHPFALRSLPHLKPTRDVPFPPRQRRQRTIHPRPYSPRSQPRSESPPSPPCPPARPDEDSVRPCRRRKSRLSMLPCMATWARWVMWWSSTRCPRLARVSCSHLRRNRSWRMEGGIDGRR